MSRPHSPPTGTLVAACRSALDTKHTWTFSISPCQRTKPLFSSLDELRTVEDTRHSDRPRLTDRPKLIHEHKSSRRVMNPISGDDGDLRLALILGLWGLPWLAS